MNRHSEETNIVIAQDPHGVGWLYFSNPIKTYSTTRVDEVKSVLAEVEYQCRSKGLYAAGSVSYEASSAFDAAFTVKTASDFPLVWFGVYEKAERYNFPDPVSLDQNDELDNKLDWEQLLSEEEYRESIAQVKDYIEDGDCYQVNYSFRLKSKISKPAWPLFVEMVHAQNLTSQRGYCVYIDTPEWSICSASPELFFHYQDGVLKSMPMKGTSPRGLGYEDDLQMAELLQLSEKNRAENIMIADMVRNDMGRIAETGSVVTTDVLSLEKYPTFWTMTTTVESKVSPNLLEIFSALFPAASITGAPKIRSMEIIDELESLPRHMYTGSAGFVTPTDRAQFNVAIRTVLVDKQKSKAEFGVGGGIIWDSHIGDEFQECLTKARVLTYSLPEFELLETIRWDPTYGYLLLDEHLDRIRNSASYFSWNIDLHSIEERLELAARRFHEVAQRVRVEVSRKGQVSVENVDLQEFPSPYRIKLAHRAINSKNYFIYHKTTNRSVYDNAMKSAGNCNDVLLWNERNEVTESCLANVIIEEDGVLYTPPISSGLLNGIGRQALLDLGVVEEKVIAKEMLHTADSIWLVNSVRDRWKVALE